MPETQAQVSNAEMAALARQFATMMHAQVNLLDIFDALREQTDNPFLREVIDSVREDAEMGRTLATAFSRYPQTFSPFFISMIRQGELEGDLDRVLSQLADHYESRLGGEVDARRRREAGAFDLEAATTAFQWLFTWVTALLALCAIGAGLIWYATSQGALPGAATPNILLLVGLIMLLGVLVFTYGRRRR